MSSLIVAGCGVCTVDWIASVDAYPAPDQKIRTKDLIKTCGGNVGNALVCLARLGLRTRILAKVSQDEIGTTIIADFQKEKIIETDHIIVTKEGNSPFSYVIVDTTNQTRTIIHTPGKEIQVDEINTNKFLDEVALLFLDSRQPTAALELANAAVKKNIPILLELEQVNRPGVVDLLPLANFAVSSSGYPIGYLKAQKQNNGVDTNTEDAFQYLIDKFPNIKWLISTFGTKGSVMIERDSSNTEDTPFAVIDEAINVLLNEERKHEDVKSCCVKNKNGSYFTVYHCAAWKLDQKEVKDTTGAGDTFNGAIMYGLLSGYPKSKMLQFASFMAAQKCKSIGARSGILTLQEANALFKQ